MKVSEFAKKCGVHDLTVRRWIKEGKIVATKVPIKPFVFALDIADEELKKILIKKPKQDGEQ